MTDEELHRRLRAAEAKARRTKQAAKGLMNLARLTVRDLAQIADELALLTAAANDRQPREAHHAEEAREPAAV